MSIDIYVATDTQRFKVLLSQQLQTLLGCKSYSTIHSTCPESETVIVFAFNTSLKFRQNRRFWETGVSSRDCGSTSLKVRGLGRLGHENTITTAVMEAKAAKPNMMAVARQLKHAYEWWS